MPPSLAELAQRREVIAQQIAQLGDLRPGCVTGTSGRCAKLSCGCHQPGEPAHGRHSNTVGRLVSNGEAMAWLGRLSPSAGCGVRAGNLLRPLAEFGQPSSLWVYG